MFQSSILSRIPLLHGTVDLVLLAIIAWALQERVQSAWQWGIIGGLLAGLATALPFGIVLAGYLTITGLALYLRRHIWQVPILGMFLLTFVGTIITQAIAVAAIWVGGTPLPLIETLNLVTLPSLLLNLLLAVPIYVLITDLANWLYPKEIEV